MENRYEESNGTLYSEITMHSAACPFTERLLQHELGSGWEPLCDFLGKDVPEVGSPHVNESKELHAWVRPVTVLLR